MKVFITILLFLLSHAASAATAITLHQGEDYQLIEGVDFLMDETNTLEIPNVQSNPNWQAVDRRNINFGFIKNTLWLRFKVIAKEDGDWVLYIPYPLLDYLENTSIINGVIGETISTGDQVKFSNRPINNPGFAFPYKLSKSDVLEVYLKVNTLGAAEIPLNFIGQQKFIDDEGIREFISGWMNGIFVVMLLYNLFIYFVVREKVYLYYVMCVFTNLLFLGVYNGVWFQVIWPSFPDINHPLFSFLNGVMYFITLLFVTEFLQISTRKAWYRSYFKYLLIVLFALPILSLIIPYQTIVLIEVFGALTMNVSGLLIGVYLSYKGEPLAKLFTLAWSIFMLGLICTNLKSFGLVPSNWITTYAFQFGSFVEVTLLSIALAYRIDAANKEKSKAQKDSIKHLEQYQSLYSGSLSGQFQLAADGTLLNVNPAFYKMLGYTSDNELLSLSTEALNERHSIDEKSFHTFLKNIKHNKEMASFESKISDRNNEKKWYSINMVGVEDESDAIKYFEGSMICINELKENEQIEITAIKDKMVAMENLVIGICHEMNTPLGVATTGLSYFIRGNEELSEILKSGKLTKYKFENFIKHGNEAILLINENLNRINVLLKRFKNISILQSNYELTEFNLCSTITEQVTLLKETLKNHTITISCPETIVIKGYPQAISDMIKQFLENSIHHGFLDNLSGEITITAILEDNNIIMVYRDNGVGIPLDKHKEIFNPFYTTRRGSSENIGLGMFQVYNIVTQRLKGEINIRDVKDGLELVIRFPILDGN